MPNLAHQITQGTSLSEVGEDFRTSKVPKSASSTFEQFEGSVDILKRSILDGKNLVQALNGNQEFNLEKWKKATESLAKQLLDVAQVINALPAPSQNRDARIGKALLPMAVYFWVQKPPNGNAELLQKLYIQKHTDPKTERLILDIPGALRSVLPYLSISQTGNKFPDAKTYVSKSLQMQGQLAEIETRANELQSQLDDQAGKRARAEERGKPSIFAETMPKLEAKLKAIFAEIPPLFDKIEDVAPEDVPEALNSIEIKVSINPKVVAELVRSVSSLEKLIVDSVRAAQGSETQSSQLQTPVLVGSGEIEVCKVDLGTEELKRIGTNPETLAKLIETLDLGRSTLRALLPTIHFSKAFTPEAPTQIRKGLIPPFAKYQRTGALTLETLLGTESPAVKISLAKLMMNPVVIDANANSWGHIIEDTRYVHLLSWAIKNYIQAKTEDDAAIFQSVLEGSPKVFEAIYSLVNRARVLHSKEDYQALAKLLNEEIQGQINDHELFRSLALVSILVHLSLEDKSAKRLRHQITELEKVKGVTSSIGESEPSLGPILSESLHLIFKKLSSSLQDFYQGEDAEELWRFIEKFRYCILHPKMFDGLRGNEMMKSGINLIGEPGVGKTHLVDCLAKDLSVPVFRISAALKTGRDDTMQDVAKKVFADAKAHSKKHGPCIIHIDEAEEIVADRDHPRTTRSQAELTNYILQETNDIRCNFPNILMIIATNFEDRIDSAMLRDGRLDFQVYLVPPVAKIREQIIRDTLEERHIPLSLNDQQIGELVQLTEGFMPLPIIRTIKELDAVDAVIMRSQGKELVWTFDLLKETFEAERRRLEQNRDRLQKRRQRVGAITPTPYQTEVGS